MDQTIDARASPVRRPRRAWRLAAVVVFGLVLASLLVLLALQLLGLGTFPGLLLIALPASLLWELGYRGSLIEWGDGWVWLTAPGITLVYSPILAALCWLFSRSLRSRRARGGRAS